MKPYRYRYGRSGHFPGVYQRGIAMVEILPLLVMFITFFGLFLGLWGAVHSGTLQSVSARHYAFEVINNRAHPEYHRDWEGIAASGEGKMFGSPQEAEQGTYHGSTGMRFFAVVAQQPSDPKSIAENRGLNFFTDMDRRHDEDPGGILSSSQAESKYRGAREDFLKETELFEPTPTINPIWLMTGYGICLNSNCGDQ